LSNSSIENSELFKSGFKEAISHERGENLKIRLQKFTSDFKTKAKCEIKNYINYYLGCDSICPGCGSKCDKEQGHTDSHKSNKHVFKSFHGWRYIESNIVVTHICWEKFKDPVNVGEKKYDSFEEYLKECHKDWLSDIESNYNDFVASKATEGKKYRHEIIRTWMNTRKAFVSKYNIIDRDDYEIQWKALEDSERMLEENFKPKWSD
jgi:hypothetical protein